jgi:small subunit ribosomal protein S9
MSNQSKEIYYYGVGRRKASTSRSKYYPGQGELEILINKVSSKTYFNLQTHQVLEVFLSNLGVRSGRFEIFTRGGGFTGQVESIRLAMSKSMVKFDEGHRIPLRTFGYLSTDVRKVLAKRPGRRKARKSEQWSKR